MHHHLAIWFTVTAIEKVVINLLNMPWELRWPYKLPLLNMEHPHGAFPRKHRTFHHRTLNVPSNIECSLTNIEHSLMNRSLANVEHSVLNRENNYTPSQTA